MGNRLLRRVLPLGLLAAVGAGVAMAATAASHGTVNAVDEREVRHVAGHRRTDGRSTT